MADETKGGGNPAAPVAQQLPAVIGPSPEQEAASRAFLKGVKCTVEAGFYDCATFICIADAGRRYRGRFRLSQAMRSGSPEGVTMPEFVPGMQVIFDGATLSITRHDPLNDRDSVTLRKQVMQVLKAVGETNKGVLEDEKTKLTPVAFATILWEFSNHCDSKSGKCVDGNLPTPADLVSKCVIQFRKDDLDSNIDGTRLPRGWQYRKPQLSKAVLAAAGAADDGSED